MKFFKASLLALLPLNSLVSGLSAAGWRSQSIYQIVTDRFARTDLSTTAPCITNNGVYCGGTWRGLISKLDYIQQMGFTAIWISPIVKNIDGNSADGSAYHGFWAEDIYSVNPAFGTRADLIALSAALHARGMYLMVDVVVNHMAYMGCGTCVDYNIYDTFNKSSYFHPYCPINYNDPVSVTQCWQGSNVVSLPDLRTEDANVIAMWNSWVRDLMFTYKIDGLRIDSAHQTGKAFFPSFESAAGAYIVGEVYNGDPNYVCPYQNYMSGVLNFPAYFWVTQAFQSTSGSISNLVNGINQMKSTCSDTTLLGSFLENHDVARFPSLTSDSSLIRNAIAFTILMDGIPIVYYGQEQQFSGGALPNDREALWLSGYPTTSPLYRYIASVNQIRNQAIYADPSYLQYKAWPIYSDNSVITMRKGSMVSVFNNQGARGGSYTLNLSSAQTGYTANQALMEILTCTAYTVSTSGTLAVAMSSGLPRVFYPRTQLIGSGVCSL